jgi:3-methylcrotonyl-CoA carboxylase alpha subunit
LIFNPRYLSPPEEVDNLVRVESGVRKGDEVSIYYDPMIAKLVVWGKDRSEALRKLKYNLDEYHISGLPTNIEFLKTLSTHPKFFEGEFDTNFIQKNYDDLFKKHEIDNNIFAIASTTLLINELKNKGLNSWESLGNFRLNSKFETKIEFKNHKDKNLSVSYNEKDNSFIVKVKDSDYHVSFNSNIKNNGEDDKYVLFINGVKYEPTIVFFENFINIFVQGKSYEFEVPLINLNKNDAESSGSVLSPMPGNFF